MRDDGEILVGGKGDGVREEEAEVGGRAGRPRVDEQNLRERKRKTRIFKVAKEPKKGGRR